MGLLNGGPDPRFNATFSPVFPPPGRLAFVTQSGGLGLAALALLTGPSLGVSGFVSVGNTADLTPNDLLLYWDEDPGTDLILAYLESVPDPRRFARIARRISRHKPIVVVKSGRTSAGRRAASSHTAAMAAGEVAVEALFHQAGVIRAGTLEDMFDVAAVLSAQPVPAGRRVAVLTNGGGPGILVADACEAAGLLVPELSDDIQAALRAGLPPEAATGNPVDIVASASAEQYGRSLRLLGAAEEIDAIIAVFIPPFLTRAEDVAREIAAAAAGLPAKPVLAVFMTAGPAPASLAEAGIPTFTYPEQAAAALGQIARWAEWRARPAGHVVTPPGIDPGRGRAAANAMLAGQPGGGWADAEAAGELLAAYGIPAARSRLVRTPAEAAAAQAELGGPVAVKIAAAIHKSDVGGVALGIDSPQAAAEAVTAIRATLAEAGIAEHAGEFLVQEQIRDGVEMIVGVSHDPAFGPLVLAGLGGTTVEVVGDVAVRITPRQQHRRGRDAPLAALLPAAHRLPPDPAAGRGGLRRTAAPGQRHGRGHPRDRRAGPQPGIRPRARRRRRRHPHPPHRMTRAPRVSLAKRREGRMAGKQGAPSASAPERAFRYNRPWLHLLMAGAKVATGQTPREVIWARNKATLYRYVPRGETRFPVPCCRSMSWPIDRPFILDLTREQLRGVPGPSRVSMSTCSTGGFRAARTRGSRSTTTSSTTSPRRSSRGAGTDLDRSAAGPDIGARWLGRHVRGPVPRPSSAEPLPGRHPGRLLARAPGVVRLDHCPWCPRRMARGAVRERAPRVRRQQHPPPAQVDQLPTSVPSWGR